MKPISLAQALLAVGLCLLPRSVWAEPREPVSGFAFDGFDGYGFLVHTEYLGAHRDMWNSSAPGSRQDLGWVLRTGLRYSHLEARLGIAGILYRTKPNGTSFQDRRIQFYPGIDEAALRLAIPWSGSAAALEFGRFRFNTNPDAVLFGEYLTRYGAYPGSVERSSPEWDSLGSLTGRVNALRFTWGGPGMRSDFLLLFDSSMVADNTDFSFALFLEGTFARGLTWGAGGELYRALSTESEGLTPHFWNNGYVKTDSGYVFLPDLLYDTIPRPREDTGYYTRSATMFSLRAAVDFGDLFGVEGEGTGGWKDWRVFTEAALLGWGDQPIIYEDRWSRLAWTIGMHAPTGGWLDELCVQAERHPSYYRVVRNSLSYIYEAIETVPGLETEPGLETIPGLEVRESGKWKFGSLASKSVWDGVAVQFQFLYQPVRTYSFSLLLKDRESPDPTRWVYQASFSLRLQARF